MINGKVTCDYCGKRINNNNYHTIYAVQDGITTGRTDMCALCWINACTAANFFVLVKERK